MRILSLCIFDLTVFTFRISTSTIQTIPIYTPTAAPEFLRHRLTPGSTGAMTVPPASLKQGSRNFSYL
jgi:hypothetical protein